MKKIEASRQGYKKRRCMVARRDSTNGGGSAADGAGECKVKDGESLRSRFAAVLIKTRLQTKQLILTSSLCPSILHQQYYKRTYQTK